jgi:hypothetical protein
MALAELASVEHRPGGRRRRREALGFDAWEDRADDLLAVPEMIVQVTGAHPEVRGDVVRADRAAAPGVQQLERALEDALDRPSRPGPAPP